MARSIAIMSLGKETGKTTLALNLGLALNKLNHKVLVYDTDFTKKNMLEHLDIYNLPVNIDQVLTGDAHINDAIYTHVSGLKLLPSTIHNPNTARYNNYSYHYQDLLANYDYIILDAPIEQPNLNTVLQNADEAIIVHDNNYSSKNVMDAINILSKLKILNLGIVMNKCSKDSVNSLFDCPVIEKIPLNKEVLKSYNLKNPLLQTYPKSKISKQFHNIAKKIE